MKTTRALSVYLIRDIAKFSGMTFKHPDRLTQAEAQLVAAWARNTPAVAKAYIDKAHPEHSAVKLFAGMLEHYLLEHPQTDFGEPAAWPDPATGERALPANAYGVATAEEAEARLAWAQTVLEYRAAFQDPNHPQHADYVAQTLELRELALPPAPAAADATLASPAATPAQAVGQVPTAQPGGLSPARIAELAQQDRDGSHFRNRIAELQKDPAYLDAKHPGHAAAVAAVTRAYSAAYPEQAPAGEGQAGGASVRPATRPSAGQVSGLLADRLKALRENPAYLDGKHPEHGVAVAAVSRVYAEAYPEAPIGSATAGQVAP